MQSRRKATWKPVTTRRRALKAEMIAALKAAAPNGNGRRVTQVFGCVCDTTILASGKVWWDGGCAYLYASVPRNGRIL